MTQATRIVEVLKARGVMRDSEIRESTGATSAAISRLLRAGHIEQMHSLNGVLLGYKLPGISISQTDDALAEIAVRHPSSVLCLFSALRHHGLTDVINGDHFGAVPMGLNRSTSLPRVQLIQWTDPKMFQVGVQDAVVAGVPLRITNPARTVADLYRPEHMRDQYGLDEEVRQHALGQLIQNEGDAGIARVSEYALALGWHEQVTEATKTARTALRWHAIPKP